MENAGVPNVLLSEKLISVTIYLFELNLVDIAQWARLEDLRQVF